MKIAFKESFIDASSEQLGSRGPELATSFYDFVMLRNKGSLNRLLEIRISQLFFYANEFAKTHVITDKEMIALIDCFDAARYRVLRQQPGIKQDDNKGNGHREMTKRAREVSRLFKPRSTEQPAPKETPRKQTV